MHSKNCMLLRKFDKTVNLPDLIAGLRKDLLKFITFGQKFRKIMSELVNNNLRALCFKNQSTLINIFNKRFFIKQNRKPIDEIPLHPCAECLPLQGEAHKRCA